MKQKTYEQLLQRLNGYIHDDDVDSSISPTLGSGRGNTVSPDLIFITRDMDLESLNHGERLLVHAMLHRFYSCGGTKDLNKKDIEQLHSEMVDLIDHVEFDKLDSK